MHQPYHWQHLANGMRLATASMPYSECATFAIYIPAGSRHDPPKQAGLAHFMEHMAFKGTARRSARELTMQLESSGAQANASTSEDHIIYDARGDASSLPLLADILSDMVWHSSLPPREIALERDVIHEEITMYEESPGDHISDLISQALWAPDPLGLPITGTHKSLDAITRNHLFSFSQKHHFRSDIVIAAAGPYSPAEFAQIIAPYLPQETTKPPAKAKPFVLGKATNSNIVQHRETEQLQLAIAYHTAGRHNQTRHALRLLSIILGESTSSRLFQRLREEQGFCYQISCDLALFEDTGCLEISAGLDPECREQAILAINAELEQLIKVGPDEEELARAKKVAITANKLALESTGAHMAWAAEGLMFDGEIVSPQVSRERLLPVTAADLRRVAAQIFIPSNRATAEIRSL